MSAATASESPNLGEAAVSREATVRTSESGLQTLSQLRRGDVVEADASLQPADLTALGTTETLSAALKNPLSAASVSFTAGLVWWLTRAGGLLTTMLLGVPAWRHVDLLPVLMGGADEDGDGDDENASDDTDSELEDGTMAELFEQRAARAANPHHAP